MATSPTIREWSKNEIARIREETDERIAHRKNVLEREIEAHAAQIEARIEHIQSRVTSFEGEMAAFFERLLAEEDPTRFAAMAETLPEPPAFDNDEVATSELVGLGHDGRGRASPQPEAAPADRRQEPATASRPRASRCASAGCRHPAPEPSGRETETPVAETAVSRSRTTRPGPETPVVEKHRQRTGTRGEQ